MSKDKDRPDNLQTPTGLIKAAFKAHPAFRYAIVVAGIAALVAVVVKFGVSGRTLVVGIIFALALMFVFLVFAAATKAKESAMRLPVQVLVWSMVLLFVLVLVLMVSSVFFNRPLPLSDWLVDRPPGAPVSGPGSSGPLPGLPPKNAGGATVGFKIVEPADSGIVEIALEDANHVPSSAWAEPQEYEARIGVAAEARFTAHIRGKNVEGAKIDDVFSPKPGETRWYALLLAGPGTGKAGRFYPIKSPADVKTNAGSAALLETNPRALVDTASLRSKPLMVRCLALTTTFESGVSDVEKAFVTFGVSYGMPSAFAGEIENPILGNLAMVDPVRAVLTGLDAKHPEIVDQAFGEEARVLRAEYMADAAKGKEWVKSISTGMKLQESWRTKFQKLGTTKEFREAALAAVEPQFEKAKKQCAAMRLRSQRGVALVFDILTMTGRIRPETQAEYDRQTAAEADINEEGRLAILAKVCTTRSPLSKRFLTERLNTIAKGTGTVVGVKYNLEDFGITLASFE